VWSTKTTTTDDENNSKKLSKKEKKRNQPESSPVTLLMAIPFKSTSKVAFDIEEHFLSQSSGCHGPKKGSRSNGDPTMGHLLSHPSELSVWGNSVYHELRRQMKVRSNS